MIIFVGFLPKNLSQIYFWLTILLEDNDLKYANVNAPLDKIELNHRYVKIEFKNLFSFT